MIFVTKVNTTLYISGQIGFVPETMEVIKGGVVAEARQALINMGQESLSNLFI